jgi:hypothetical protein
MGENHANKTKNYPVEVKAVNIRWFILSKHGIVFLTKILNNENIELYKIPTLRIIIGFLYIRYKRYLFYKDFPLFALTTVIFIIKIWLIEKLIIFGKNIELEAIVDKDP